MKVFILFPVLEPFLSSGNSSSFRTILHSTHLLLEMLAVASLNYFLPVTVSILILMFCVSSSTSWNQIQLVSDLRLRIPKIGGGGQWVPLHLKYVNPNLARSIIKITMFYCLINFMNIINFMNFINRFSAQEMQDIEIREG